MKKIHGLFEECKDVYWSLGDVYRLRNEDYKSKSEALESSRGSTACFFFRSQSHEAVRPRDRYIAVVVRLGLWSDRPVPLRQCKQARFRPVPTHSSRKQLCTLFVVGHTGKITVCSSSSLIQTQREVLNKSFSITVGSTGLTVVYSIHISFYLLTCVGCFLEI